MRTIKMRQGFALIGFAMLFFSLFCIIGVEASTTEPSLAHKTPLSFEFTNDPVEGEDVFDKYWISDDGILHTRGYDHIGEVWGDLVGALTYDGDLNLNLATFDGTGGGTVCFDVDYNGLSGTFEGRMVIKIYMDEGIPYIDAKFICHGDGDFNGMHLKGTAFGIMGTSYAANAILLNPNA